MATRYVCDGCDEEVPGGCYAVVIRLPLLEDTWGGQRNRFEFCSDRCAADWLTKRSSLEPATQPAPRSKWWKDWWS